MKYYFDDNQSYDRAQKLLEKVNKGIPEEYSTTYVSVFLDLDINERRDTTPQYDLCSIRSRIHFKIRVPTSGNISSTRRREQFSSNINHNYEVIDTSNTTSEISEDESYGRRSNLICTIYYVCILLLMQLSLPFQIYYF